MSLINKEISDFKVDAFQKKEGSAQGEFKQYTKADLKGKWSVFFFYPTELADLQDQYAEFQKLGCEIFGVSCDSHFVHKAWHESSDLVGRLTYPMLADPTAKLARDFDVYIEEDGRSERGTFVVNPEGKIVSYEVSAGNVGRNAAELLRKVQALQFVAEHGDEVCPARWKPGEKTLKPSFDLVGKL